MLRLSIVNERRLPPLITLVMKPQNAHPLGLPVPDLSLHCAFGFLRSRRVIVRNGYSGDVGIQVMPTDLQPSIRQRNRAIILRFGQSRFSHSKSTRSLSQMVRNTACSAVPKGRKAGFQLETASGSSNCLTSEDLHSIPFVSSRATTVPFGIHRTQIFDRRLS